MITRALAALKEVFIPKSEIDEEELECSVDDTSIDCVKIFKRTTKRLLILVFLLPTIFKMILGFPLPSCLRNK